MAAVTQLRDLKVENGFAIRTEPHHRFYTDRADTVSVAVPALVRNWPMLFFCVFNLARQDSCRSGTASSAQLSRRTHLADDVVANTTRTDRRLGMPIRTATLAFDDMAIAYRSRMEVLLAGRAAEEVLLGEASHGAREDLADATEILRNAPVESGRRSLRCSLGSCAANRLSRARHRSALEGAGIVQNMPHKLF